MSRWEGKKKRKIAIIYRRWTYVTDIIMFHMQPNSNLNIDILSFGRPPFTSLTHSHFHLTQSRPNRDVCTAHCWTMIAWTSCGVPVFLVVAVRSLYEWERVIRKSERIVWDGRDERLIICICIIFSKIGYRQAIVELLGGGAVSVVIVLLFE